MLTSRERLRRCFFHEELDRPGVFVRTGIPRGDTTYEPLRALLKERTDLKAGFPAGAVIEQPPMTSRVEPHSEEWERRIVTLHTPAGDLVETTLVSLCHQPGMEEEPLLKTVEDAEKYLSQPMPKIGGDVERFFQLDREIGDRGIVDVSLGRNPGAHPATLFGSTNFAMLSITDRDVLHALCARRMRIVLAALDYLLERDVGPYFSMAGQEYVAPPLHGKADFDDFNLRYDKVIIDRVHEAGGRVHVHCHGRIRTILPSFLAMGTDVLHPFEPPPMGDITAAEAKAMIRGRMTMEGNVQISDMYESTPEEIREQVRRLIADAFDDRRGLIVCPSASPYIWQGGAQCYPQFEALVDAVVNWR